jgi:uncharacterized GH25 family protein
MNLHKTQAMLVALAAFAGLALAPAAQAHHVWIEQDAQAATLYFGEFSGNLREASPGLLDRFVKPRALRQTAAGTTPVALEKTPRGYVAAVRAGNGEALLAEEATYPISERKQGEQVTRSLYHPAARFSAGLHKQAPVLALDLVPVGQPAAGEVEVQAFYKGQPLPKAKVAVVTASGWAQEHRTGDDGRLRLALPWRGTYVLEIAHSDTTPGERMGASGSERYDRASYVTALSFVLGEGLPALPAAPAAAPNKP